VVDSVLGRVFRTFKQGRHDQCVQLCRDPIRMQDLFESWDVVSKTLLSNSSNRDQTFKGALPRHQGDLRHGILLFFICLFVY